LLVCRSRVSCLHNYNTHIIHILYCHKINIKYVSLSHKLFYTNIQQLQTQHVAQLSHRDRTAGWVRFGHSGRSEPGDNILWTIYVYLQPLRHNWLAKLSNLVAKIENKGCCAIQGHRGWYQLKGCM